VSRAVFYSCFVVSGLLIFPGAAFPQNLMRGSASGGSVQLIGNDSAVLESGETRKDLPCTVTPVKPLLGFDLRFHSGYEIGIPMRELAGDGDQLTIIFRVTAAASKDSPYYFSQKYSVPEIDSDAKGDAFLAGGFDVGEGDYHVDWMMRDRVERICSSNWDVTAALATKDQNMKLALSPNTIDTSDQEFF
jgi:hypothetical protein